MPVFALRIDWRLAASLLAAVLAMTGCGTLRQPSGTPVSKAFSPATGGVLAESSRAIQNSRGDSAFQLLEKNKEAFDWRLALCDHATRSIDAQYFIWQDDEAGNLLFTRLLAAADRGVRVRVLVDDMVFGGTDHSVAALSQHPNLEIRLFNPSAVRRGTVRSLANFLVHFRELNRRMHNKLFVADNRMAIVGGRNIGNAYFGLSGKYNFRDLDVLVAGPVVPEISGAFDEYWNDEMSVPGQTFSKKATIEDARELQAEAVLFLEERADILTSYPLQRRDWRSEMRAFTRTAHLGEAHFLQDEPLQVRGEEVRLVDMIDYLAAPSHEELLMVSPYLIPVGDFMDDMNQLSREGVNVRVLTGSMESNNHTIAHSHYKKYRKPILESGARLNEYRGWPDQGQRRLVDVNPVDSHFVALHTKTLVGDRRRCFIGSLNLDPRAVVINTENGLLIESPGLAEELAVQIEAMASPDNAWSVTKDARGRLLWKSSAGVRAIQPARGFGQRVGDFFFQFLPIESQL